jgi:2',3'-cyclic-nucleotide 2'-phosphodiesterase (5'-nucleotidase family)
VARLKKVVDDLKDEHGNVIFVNGGDFYQGTIWYTKFKWKVVSKFANLLNFTAMV